ncbi:MAG: multicopper oxidase family protein [Vicinamibacterales bacterium]
MTLDRRTFLKVGGLTALASGAPSCGRSSDPRAVEPTGPADYTLRIGTGLVELAPDRILATTVYNGQFPGPLMRLREGRPVTVDLYNDTDTPEQLHWHGQIVPVDVDGAAEEGTPDIPPHGHRRMTFTPAPAGVRFYHTHNHAGPDLRVGQYSGQVGIVYVEPKDNPGAYDQEVFLMLKEFDPAFSRGGDMPADFLAGEANNELHDTGEFAMRASLAKGMPHGFEVGYQSFAINGKMLGHGEPIRVKANERVLIHVVNGSATEIRSLALPGHTFEVVALDGNPVPTRVEVPVLWIGTGERVSAVVRMTHPGAWILGDLSDDDRAHGMGVVIEYSGAKGKPQWIAPQATKWDYSRFGKADATVPAQDATIDMVFSKDNATVNGFNRWLINGAAFSMEKRQPMFPIQRGKRYRLRMRNASDDIHPMHLHRHSFELTKVAGRQTAGVVKDVVMLAGYQEIEVDFTANSTGLSLFHCHMQLHMDYGFMALFDCR